MGANCASRRRLVFSSECVFSAKPASGAELIFPARDMFLGARLSLGVSRFFGPGAGFRSPQIFSARGRF
ncbi:MAG: hypothetical protein DBY09_02150 [Selenomonadales bacterium]|nr:MAG: hypothetical protein DBY09_02150 [Selenomonadales bacterium]